MFRQFSIYTALALFALGIAVLYSNLISQFRAYAVADRDIVPWTMLRLDSEFSNLKTALDTYEFGKVDEAEVRLRLDVALSRLNLMQSGVAGYLLEAQDEGPELLDELRLFERAAIEIADQPGSLDQQSFETLQSLTNDALPISSRLTMLGLQSSVVITQDRRIEFEQVLQRSAFAGGILVVSLLIFLGLLFWANRRAREKENAASASRARLQSAVSASLDAIIIANEQGQIIEYNSAAEDILGWARHEILGRNIADTIVPPSLRSAHTEGMARFLATGEKRVSDSGRIEISTVRKSGEEFPSEINITSAKAATGTEFFAYIRDITDRIDSQNALIDALEKAESMNRAKSEFLAFMSHEMRTPLNGILGVLDLLRDSEIDARQKGYVKIATASSENLIEMVNEALDITRIETGDLRLNLTQFELSDLVHGCLAIIEPLALEKRLSLTFDLPQHLKRHYHSDEGRIRQILVNLLGNAVKFTDHGKIKLSVASTLHEDHHALCFTVSDTGPGIPPKDQSRIFDRHIVGSTANGRQSRSDGLGLPIARRLARLLGGDLTLDTTSETGASFHLTIPAQQVANPTVQAPTMSETLSPARSKTVLIVEDNGINRQILKDMLHGLGHKVVEAKDGLQGVEQSHQAAFDLILMDISMPNMDGIEATQTIRSSDSNNRATPIIGLTAHGAEEYKERALSAGMNDLIVKPIRLSILQKILDQSNPTRHQTSHPDQADEIIELIGRKAYRSHVAKLLNELAQFIEELDALPATTTDLKAEAHRLKGAAGLLGFTDLHDMLEGPEQNSVSLKQEIEKANKKLASIS